MMRKQIEAEINKIKAVRSNMNQIKVLRLIAKAIGDIEDQLDGVDMEQKLIQKPAPGQLSDKLEKLKADISEEYRSDKSEN